MWYDLSRSWSWGLGEQDRYLVKLEECVHCGPEKRRYFLVEVQSTVLPPFCGGHRDIGVRFLLGQCFYPSGTVIYFVSQVTESYLFFTTCIISHRCPVDCMSETWLQFCFFFNLLFATAFLQTRTIIFGLGNWAGLPPVCLLFVSCPL